VLTANSYLHSLPSIYTIGHSTRTLDELIEALRAHSIVTLVDIRAFPVSRRLPHFNRESLEKALPAAGIEYAWKQALGGRRKKLLEESPNTGLRVQAFRNYADYMLTPEFQDAAAELLQMAAQRRVAIMCAERVFFHCHRILVSDYLALHGNEVLHIDATGPVRPHRVTPEAKLVNGELMYPGLF
jgi:uncharacterized protein (DUF488 family)